MHAQRCIFSLGKVLLKIVVNLQKDRFHKVSENKFFLEKVLKILEDYGNLFQRFFV